MGLWGGIKTFGADLATGGAYSAGKDAKKSQEEANRMNAETRKRRLRLVGHREAPQVAQETSNRLKFLNQQASQYQKPQALEQDATFQGQRAQLVSGATQQAAGIQNQQRALGVQGGTSNLGSVQDSYDRLNTSLAGLAGDQQKYRADKANEYSGAAADLSQGIVDRGVEETNTRLALKDAIEAGNVDAALAALQNYTRLKTEARTQGYGSVTGMAGNIGGGYLSGRNNQAAATGGVK